MKTTVSEYDFLQAFKDYGREEDFSHDALIALYNFYDEVYDTDYELDVIAICCEWCEYTLEELAQDFDYAKGAEECEDLDDWGALLSEHTTVLKTNNTLVVSEF